MDPISGCGREYYFSSHYQRSTQLVCTYGKWCEDCAKEIKAKVNCQKGPYPTFEFIIYQALDDLSDINMELKEFNIPILPPRDLIIEFQKRVNYIQVNVLDSADKMTHFTRTKKTPLGSAPCHEDLIEQIKITNNLLQKWIEFIDNHEKGIKYTQVYTILEKVSQNKMTQSTAIQNILTLSGFKKQSKLLCKPLTISQSRRQAQENAYKNHSGDKESLVVLSKVQGYVVDGFYELYLPEDDLSKVERVEKIIQSPILKSFLGGYTTLFFALDRYKNLLIENGFTVILLEEAMTYIFTPPTEEEKVADKSTQVHDDTTLSPSLPPTVCEADDDEDEIHPLLSDNDNAWEQV